MYFTLGCLFILHHVSYIQPSLSHSQSRRLVQALTTWAVGKNPNWSVDLQSLLDLIQPLHCHQIEFSKIKLNFSQKVPPPQIDLPGFPMGAYRERSNYPCSSRDLDIFYRGDVSRTQQTQGLPSWTTYWGKFYSRSLSSLMQTDALSNWVDCPWWNRVRPNNH